MTTTTAIAEYSRTEAGLAELRQRYGATVWVTDTPEQLKGARAARSEIRGWRYDLEKMRKEIKGPALKRCREIDTEAARLTDEFLKLEEPIDSAIKAAEEEEKRVKEEKIHLEQERKAKHRAEIDRIRRVPVDLVEAGTADLKRAAEELKAMSLTGFEEFQDEAGAARDASITSLRAMYTRARSQEDEKARLDAERAELARLRSEQEAKARAEREKREAEEAEMQARLEAERAELRRQQDEQAAREKAEREKREAESHAIREKLEAEERETRARIAAQEREAAARRAAEEQAAREAREKADAEARAARAKADEEARKVREAEEARIAEERRRADAERQAKDAAERKEREAREATELEEKRKRMFTATGRDMLQVFLFNYSDEPEFASVVAVIRDYFAALAPPCQVPCESERSA